MAGRAATSTVIADGGNGPFAGLCKVSFLRISAIGGSRSIRHRCGFLLKGCFREIGLTALRLQRRTF
jgi:hypothetical protein